MLDLLDVSQAASLGVDVLDLARALGVEVDNLASGVGGGGLLKVRVETGEEVVGAVGDAVALVGGLGAVGGMVLLVEVLNGGQEARRNAVLGVEVNGVLDGGIANDVAVGEVFGQDTGARLLLLRNVVRLALAAGGRARAVRVGAARAGHGNVVGTELSVVEQESSLHGRLLFEGDFGRLGLTLGGDFDVGDLSAIDESVIM